MSLQTPTTQQLSDKTVAQVGAALSQTIPIFPKAFIRVLAKVFAGAVIILYKYGSYIFLQMFVRHASMEESTIGNKRFVPLIEHGRFIGIGTPGAATRAQLVVSVPVTSQTGALKAGAKLQRNSTGIVYQVMVDVALNASIVQATIQAVSKTDDPNSNGAGSVGNLSPGDVVSFVNPYPNVGSDCTAVSQVVQGADAQAPEDYRRSVLQRFQARPQGGAYADYRAWALSVGGIVNAYPYAGDVPGGVDVYVEADAASSGSSDGVPTEAQLTAVKNALQFDAAGNATRAPAGVEDGLQVLGISRRAFAVTIVGLSPDTPATRQAITDGIDEYLWSREPFIVGLSVLPRLDSISRAGVSGVVDSIANAQAATVDSVSLSSGSLYVLDHGEKAKLGSVTFVAPS